MQLGVKVFGPSPLPHACMPIPGLRVVIHHLALDLGYWDSAAIGFAGLGLELTRYVLLQSVHV